MSVTQSLPFGTLLKQLRKRAGMTQRDLAAALGYSDSLISSLEKAQRQPDLDAVIQHFIPALGLQDDLVRATRLLESAAALRGEQPPDIRWHEVTRQRANSTTESEPAQGLPALPIELIGRQELVHQLGNRLRGHGGRLLTLVGPPGVGKTTMALAAAQYVQRHYREGARFVPLAAASDPMLMATTIVATVAPGDASNKPPQSRLIELLRRQSLLLILDNLEQIEGAGNLIASLLAECPALTILATSRERLHLRAEQRCKVPPLDLDAAVELFVQRAQAVDDSFCLTDENRSTIAAICTRLDCLPLALELCAAQIELFSLSQLLAQLQARPLDLLVDGAHDLPPQHRTLRQAIQRSYALLKPEEQLLFRYLGVFVGGFNLAAVEAISNLQQPSDILRALIGKSLVRAETLGDGEQRFFLLETIREFALEQLRVHGEEEQARQWHYGIYLQRFRTADSHLRGTDAPAWFARLQPEYDNLRAAIRWTLDSGRYEDTAWLIIITGWYCRLRGHWYEELRWHQELVPHRQHFDPTLRLESLIKLFSVASASAEYEQVNRYLNELIELAEACPVKLLRAAAWARVAMATADFTKAISAWQKAMALVRDAQDPPVPGIEFGVNADYLFIFSATAASYAALLMEHGDYRQATSLLQESLAACEARGYVSGIGATLGTLGRLALLQGDLAQARNLLQQAVATIKTTIHPSVLAKIQPHLAIVTLYHHEAAEARRLLMESLAIWNNIKDPLYLARISIYLAETALWEADIPEAERWLAQYLDYPVDPRRIGITLVNCLFVAARLAVARQHDQRAATLLGLAEETRARAHCALVEPVRVQVEAASTTVQRALDPAAFTAAFAAGQQLSPTEAFTILLPFPAPTMLDNPASAL